MKPRLNCLTMFIVSLTYVRPLAEVDALLARHNEFLDRRYHAGDFLLSGRKEPRTGGVIVAVGASRQKLLDMLEEDPFKVHGVATYEVVEFTPSRARHDLAHLVGPAARPFAGHS
jgi:uncharacterized protein YciI